MKGGNKMNIADRVNELIELTDMGTTSLTVNGHPVLIDQISQSGIARYLIGDEHRQPSYET